MRLRGIVGDRRQRDESSKGDSVAAILAGIIVTPQITVSLGNTIIDDGVRSQTTRNNTQASGTKTTTECLAGSQAQATKCSSIVKVPEHLLPALPVHLSGDLKTSSGVPLVHLEAVLGGPLLQPSGVIGNDANALPPATSTSTGINFLPATTLVGNDTNALPPITLVGNDTNALPPITSVGNDTNALPPIILVGNGTNALPTITSVGNDTNALPPIASIGNDADAAPQRNYSTNNVNTPLSSEDFVRMWESLLGETRNMSLNALNAEPRTTHPSSLSFQHPEGSYVVSAAHDVSTLTVMPSYSVSHPTAPATKNVRVHRVYQLIA